MNSSSSSSSSSIVSRTTPRVLVVDHRDSFVFNLVDDLARLGLDPVVVRSDIALDDLTSTIARTTPSLVVLSPGPGAPTEAGVMIPFLRSTPHVPVLGVCLGMQAMACALRGTVGRAPRPVHGEADRIVHDGDIVFDDIPNGFRAARYHSLVITAVPDELHVIATIPDGDSRSLPMAVRHRTLPWIGLQFHPESILTPDGPRLLRNILRTTSSGSSALPARTANMDLDEDIHDLTHSAPNPNATHETNDSPQ